MLDKPYENRLIKEKSPYLLQHAHNPVDWYPWGEEAFQKAKDEDKPIFLSIGYATCHWCHVMGRESFNNPQVAKEMNDVFISIKVDREELPEIDSLYMEFAQALMASGTGWPLNVILTPDLKPFYAVTYLPTESRQDTMGLKQLIDHIRKLWNSEEKELLFDQANKLVDLFEKSVTTRGEEVPDEGLVDAAASMLFEGADPVYGGQKGSPKFPVGYQWQFFLTYAKLYDDARALYFAEQTLGMIYQGGIYDHIGGGFSRYSIDEKWQIPHFEKMLYDNALLAGAYLDAWRSTKRPLYKKVTEEVLDYTLREMKHPEGGFFSAEDAELDGVEGAYYLWTKKEIDALLSKEASDLFSEYFNVTDRGNFKGKNVLHRSYLVEDFCDFREYSLETVEKSLDNSLKILRKERSKRKRPFKDDKVLVSWNSLMIDTLVKAGMALGNHEYLAAGIQAMEFILKHHLKDGMLLRRFRDGDAQHEGCLDDIASFTRALITLYESGQGKRFLDLAIEQAAHLESLYKAEGGAFYFTGPDHSILLRRCELYDSSQPSGNALHAENLLRLYQITHSHDYLVQAEDILKVANNFIETYPQGATYHLQNLMRYLDQDLPTLVVSLDQDLTLKNEIQNLVFSNYIPHLTLSFRENSKEYPLEDGKTTFYFCSRGRCHRAITDFKEVENFIDRL